MLIACRRIVPRPLPREQRRKPGPVGGRQSRQEGGEVVGVWLNDGFGATWSATSRIRRRNSRRAISYVGSLLDWGSRGRGFKSRRPDYLRRIDCRDCTPKLCKPPNSCRKRRVRVANGPTLRPLDFLERHRGWRVRRISSSEISPPASAREWRKPIQASARAWIARPCRARR